MRVLDDVNARSLASFWVGILCMGPMHWIREWGLAYGIYPWVSTLVMEIEGRRFWVERGRFFLGEELQDTTAETFSQDDTSSKQPCLCYILYIVQWKFRCIMSSDHHEGGPRSSIVLGIVLLVPSRWGS